MAGDVNLFCGVCDRINLDGEWKHTDEKRNPELSWKNTYCRFCIMEMTYAKNKKICDQLNLRLMDILKTLPVIGAHLSVYQAAKVLAEEKRGVIGAISEGVLVGIMTDRDYSQKIVAQDMNVKETLVADIMSYPVISIHKSASIPEAALKMSLHNVRHLVVVSRSQNNLKVVSARSIAESMQNILSQMYTLTEKDLSKKKKY